MHNQLLKLFYIFQMNVIATFHTLPSLNPCRHRDFVNFMFQTGFRETGDLNKLQPRKMNLFVGASLEKWSSLDPKAWDKFVFYFVIAMTFIFYLKPVYGNESKHKTDDSIQNIKSFRKAWWNFHQKSFNSSVACEALNCWAFHLLFAFARLTIFASL